MNYKKRRKYDYRENNSLVVDCEDVLERAVTLDIEDDGKIVVEDNIYGVPTASIKLVCDRLGVFA